VDAFRDNQDVGLRAVDWGSSCGLLPELIDHLGEGERFDVLAAEPTRFSAIGYGHTRRGAGVQSEGRSPLNMRLKLTGGIVPMESEFLCAGAHELSFNSTVRGGLVARSLSAIR